MFLSYLMHTMSIRQDPRPNQIALYHCIALAVAVQRRERVYSCPRTVRGLQVV